MWEDEEGLLEASKAFTLMLRMSMPIDGATVDRQIRALRSASDHFVGDDCLPRKLVNLLVGLANSCGVEYLGEERQAALDAQVRVEEEVEALVMRALD